MFQIVWNIIVSLLQVTETIQPLSKKGILKSLLFDEFHFGLIVSLIQVNLMVLARRAALVFSACATIRSSSNPPPLLI